MNLKLRFAIFITCFVAIILLVSSIAIYFLYKSNRVDDHYMRLRARTSTLLTEYRSFRLDSVVLSKTRPYTASLNMLQMILAKSPKDIVFRENDTINLSITDSLLNAVKKHKELRYKQGPQECLGTYVPDLNIYVICGAVDKTGLRKLSHLFYILIGVFISGVLISALLSFVMVQQAFRPLIKLSQQMELTTSANLSTKVDEGRGKDELEQIARNFNAMLDRLNESFERQRSFVQHASHELRTPLTKMVSQTESALSRELSIEEHKDLLLSLQDDQIELVELTNSLLVLSQFEKINTVLNWPVLRIDELLYESVSDCNRFFNDIDIEINFGNTPASEEELLLRGNEVLLKSAFRNLIKNAYLYSPDKKVNILIETQSGTINIAFTNKGNVLTPEEIKKMYIPFFRGSNAVMSKGFGLGLSIINKIVEMHDAKLSYTALDTDTNKFAISFHIKPMAKSI